MTKIENLTERIARGANNRRRTKGVTQYSTPSEHFDWDRAIAGFKQILKEVYG